MMRLRIVLRTASVKSLCCAAQWCILVGWALTLRPTMPIGMNETHTQALALLVTCNALRCA